ncbi:guanylate cyclase soluble subunit beta-2-like [Littorina saxatilis]|uniref:guanylate cyclase n=1 Tax=Littorina saxatilis TaxID=31220 RepID=A0AAN9BC20_9CAEN
MYGQIHCVFRELVEEQFGKDQWRAVLAKSGLDEMIHFMVFTQYPDPLTFKLLGAVAEVLEITTETVLKVFGGFFLTYCLRHGYDKMLKTLGGDIISFIQNLDSLHYLLALSNQGIAPPSFRCEEEADGNLTLHYYSQRAGLYPIVIGMLEAVGKELFHQNVTLTVLHQSQLEIATAVTSHHTIFRVTLEFTSNSPNFVKAKSAFRYNPQTTSPEQVSTPKNKYKDFVLKADDFCAAFPYHIMFNKSLCIEQIGDNVRRLTTVHISDDTPFKAIGDIVQPVMHQTIENIFLFINAVFLVAIYRSPDDKTQPFMLRGQMVWMEHSQVMIFIGSPRLTSLNELLEMNVFLADIPLYDCTRELVLLNQQRMAEIDIAKKLDETTTKLRLTSAALEVEKQRTEDLLHEMLPKKVAMELTQGNAVKADKFECVTIVFSDIVTFTDIAAACNPMDIINMLNELYHRFDNHTNEHDVYKVETVGDAYMAVAGAPEVQEDHADRIADFAMAMMKESSHVQSPATGKPLQIRIGLHSGPVVAGVVGKKMPRYCLFGDTVNTTSRMESTGVPGRIHVSNSVYMKLFPYGYTFKDRGEIEVKGKGKMHTYFLVGYLSHHVKQPQDEFKQLPDVKCDRPCIRTHPSRPVKRNMRKSFNFLKKSSSKTLDASGTGSETVTDMSNGVDDLKPRSTVFSRRRRPSAFCLIV